MSAFFGNFGKCSVIGAEPELAILLFDKDGLVKPFLTSPFESIFGFRSV